jgi:GR25 family glycosyltransferase involved in LPS biosynthesis
MIIKVISLKKSIDRREYISKQFSKLGIYFDFQDAVDPNSCSKKILSFFSAKKFHSRYGRKPILGEIGSILSHYFTLKKFLKLQKQKTLMILEDDAQIMCTKKELLSVVNNFEKSKYDILILGFTKCDDAYEKHYNIINPILPICKINGKINIGPRYLYSFCGAVGYLVKKKSAKIISKYSPTSILADDWNYFSKLGLKIMFTNPMIIRENHIKVSSTMGHINRSLTFKKSENLIVKFLLFSRKHIYGLIRLVILFLKYKLK